MREITDAVLSRSLPKNGTSLRVLDAGCGTGFNVLYYSRLGRAFGLDLSAAAMTSVRKRGLQTVCQADVTQIPYASETFDAVLSFDVICQGQNPPVEGGLREMRRVLRPGGHLFVRVP